MELALFFYAAGVTESVGLMFLLLSVAVFIITAIYALMLQGAAMEDYIRPDTRAARKAYMKEQLGKAKGLLITAAIMFFISGFLPSKDTMYTMAAAYGVQSAAENPNVQRVAGKSLQLLEGKLDEYLKEDKK